MDHSDEEQRQIEASQLPTKEKVSERYEAHDNASNGVTPFPPQTVDHFRNPGAAYDGREGKGAHDDADICFRAAVTGNKERKEKKGAYTGYGEQVGCGHQDKGSVVEAWICY